MSVASVGTQKLLLEQIAAAINGVGDWNWFETGVPECVAGGSHKWELREDQTIPVDTRCTVKAPYSLHCTKCSLEHQHVGALSAAINRRPVIR